MSLERYFAFGKEGTSEVATCVFEGITFDVGVGFRKAESEDDDQDRRARTEPVQWSPGMLRRVDQSSCEDGGQQIPKGVALL